jgi:hypothetical protein
VIIAGMSDHSPPCMNMIYIYYCVRVDLKLQTSREYSCQNEKFSDSPSALDCKYPLD